MPRVSQELSLICGRCGKKGAYDVGLIFSDQEGEGASASRIYSFANYFRCRHCDAPGPWEIADYLKLLGLALGNVIHSSPRFVIGRCELFDGTCLQTPAMGEEYLRGLIQKDPGNAFLHTRLGNLFRACGQDELAEEWYEKAIRLDPGDLEARYHLYAFAVTSGNIPAAATHAPLFIRYLLEGRRTEKDELTRGVVEWVVDALRHAPDEFRQRFHNLREPLLWEEAFMCALWEEEGDEEQIIHNSAELLLAGIVKWPSAHKKQNPANSPDLVNIDMMASLQEIVQAEALNPEALSVPVETDGQRHIRIQDKHLVPVYDQKKLIYWPVPSLRSLFRGDKLPPADLDHYPPDYALVFYRIENHLLTACDALGNQTDQDLEGIYSALRRRPDGKSQGLLHDFLWQVAALTLGTHSLSQAEFEGIFGQLARSTRHWQQQPVSRNYLAYLRQTLRKDMPD